MKPPDAVTAAQQLLERRAARRGLIPFTQWTYPRYQPSAIHYRIAEQLERVERGDIDRLMLLVPPRHGKSELASRRFPAWYLGRHPERQFISASAGHELAEEFGRDVRNIIASPDYAALVCEEFGTTLAIDSQAKGRWHTSEGGAYYAVGVGSQLMGRGGHVILIDDPFGAMADARSEVERRAVHEWYKGTVYNRLENKGAIILINHRMHEDDLTGMLLQQQAAGGDSWEVVELKPDMEKGEALWPEKYPIDVLERIKRNSPLDFAALYLQDPTPEEGDYFKTEWLKTVQKLPAKETMAVYGASDYAVTSNGGDYTVHIVVGVDPDDRMYVLDMWRGQTDPSEWIDAWCDMVKAWKPSFWAEETGQITASVGPFLEARARDRKAYCGRERFPSRYDKSVRAQSIRGRMALNGLYLPMGLDFPQAVRSELLAFPNGKHDDIVDALGLIGQLLDRVQKGQRPRPKEKEPLDTSYDVQETSFKDSFLTM